MQKRAFVIMPIRKMGSDEYQYFRALYDEVLKPTLEIANFSTERADDIQKSGAIGKDIIVRLAEAELVVADLTDLNPNVFYELGVRHVLRGSGTVMIQDELKTNDIPFDLSSYRVIKFRGELNGIGRLRVELSTYAKNLDHEASVRDNPVHGWLPVLPLNSLEAASGTIEGKLREELARAHNTVRQYEKIVGPLSSGGARSSVSPQEIIAMAVRDAEEGNLATDLLDSARSAAQARDHKGFLKVLQRIMERSDIRLDAQEYDSLSGTASGLGLGDIASAILAHGLSLHPQSEELKRSQLSRLAHSSDSNERNQARAELAKTVGIAMSDGQVVPPPQMSREKLALFGIMLDAYDTDGLYDEELKIARAVAEKFPDRTTVCRNMARALGSAGQEEEEIWQWYKKGILAPDAADISATWYGNDLHNAGRHVDALEAYLIGCTLDPNDGANFAHVAYELSHVRYQRIVGKVTGRELPDSADLAHGIRQFVLASFSCRNLDMKALNRCRLAARNAEIDIRDLEEVLVNSFADSDAHEDSRKLSLEERMIMVRNLYDVVKSDVTLRD